MNMNDLYKAELLNTLEKKTSICTTFRWRWELQSRGLTTKGKRNCLLHIFNTFSTYNVTILKYAIYVSVCLRIQIKSSYYV